MSGVVRRLAYAKDRSYKTYSSFVENAPPEVAANTLLCLIHQTNYLLDRLLQQLEQAFLRDGGLTERLYQARRKARSIPPRPAFHRIRTNSTNPSQPNRPNPPDVPPQKKNEPKRPPQR